MEDNRCVQLLQYVLPQMRMQWRGFRKVRNQVCKRIHHRINELHLVDAESYLDYLQTHPDEWPVLDHACRVTVSRFYRDKIVLEHVQKEVLPALALAATDKGATALHGWSAGCAMGEEAYSLLLIWDNTVGRNLPRLDLDVVGSDIDELLLYRARRACYSYSSVKALPDAWLQAGFVKQGNQYCLEPRLREKASFIQQDIRHRSITGPFHIIFCRNLVFTYYENTLQLELLRHIHNTLVDGGALVIGGHESLPEGYCGFEPWSLHRAIFRKQ
jgi:chemotaxis protein methyltransferase CheR